MTPVRGGSVARCHGINYYSTTERRLSNCVTQLVCEHLNTFAFAINSIVSKVNNYKMIAFFSVLMSEWLINNSCLDVPISSRLFSSHSDTVTHISYKVNPLMHGGPEDWSQSENKSYFLSLCDLISFCFSFHVCLLWRLRHSLSESVFSILF